MGGWTDCRSTPRWATPCAPSPTPPSAATPKRLGRARRFSLRRSPGQGLGPPPDLGLASGVQCVDRPAGEGLIFREEPAEDFLVLEPGVRQHRNGALEAVQHMVVHQEICRNAA